MVFCFSMQRIRQEMEDVYEQQKSHDRVMKVCVKVPLVLYVIGIQT